MTTHRRRSAVRRACLTSAVVPLALGFALAGCGATDGTVRTVSRDSAGVTIVESNGSGTALPWTVTRIARIEGSPSSPFHRVHPPGLAFRDDGALYVLDGGDQVVHLFDATGAYERTIGRPGQGPGEFELAYALAVRSDTLIVDDAARRHFVKFSRAGEFIANAPAPAAMDDAVAFVPRMAYRVRGIREGRHIVELRLAADSGFSTVVGQPDTLRRSITFERCGIRISLPPVFAPEFEWAAGGEHLVVSRSVDYSMEVYHADSLVSILRRSLPSLEATESLALEEIGEGEQITVGNGKTCTIPPQEVVRKRGYYAVVPPIKRIALDPGGYIWVMRTEASAGRPAIDIVHIRDGYIGTLPPDFPWPEAFGPGDIFASLELDSLDVPTIGYYTITR